MENVIPMKSIINYFRKRKEERLRERCVKYSIKAHEGRDKGFTVSDSAQDIELYIKDGMTSQGKRHQ